jgi:glycosyltransferase involved in cell wall biosynthesis
MSLSVIVPALKMDEFFSRCIASIRAAFEKKVDYEVVVVSPDIEQFASALEPGVNLVKDAGRGIYSAMNQGIQNSQGDFIYFVGQDDVVLPPAAEMVLSGKRKGADLVLADVYWGGQGIFRNPANPGFLVWRNWCHQGVAYRRTFFTENLGVFPLEFEAQSDHFANIILATVPGVRIEKSPSCAAWYSGDGYSSRSPDLAFRRAFPGLVLKRFGVFQYSLVVIRRAFLRLFFQKRFKGPRK